MALRRLWLLEIATSIEDAALMVSSTVTVCGVLVWAVRSAVTDLSQYSLQLQFSDTDYSSYLHHGIGFPFDSPHMTASS